MLLETFFKKGGDGMGEGGGVKPDGISFAIFGQFCFCFHLHWLLICIEVCPHSQIGLKGFW